VNKKPGFKQPQFRAKRASAAMAMLLVFTAQTALANPLGPAVVNGQASFATSGNTLTVTNTPGAIINWQGFSVGANEVTRFVQQNAASSVLNRVISNNPSSILGALQSNGRVFLVNPNGIVFGQGATVDVAGLVATTLNLSNADFLAGRHNFTEVPGAQGISNAGSLAAQSGGQIYLIAPDVENTGIITAPNGEILLAAGHSVELVNSIEPNLRVNITAPAGDATNVGQLIAASGSLGLFGTVVKNSGTVSADSATTQGGKVVFKASQRTEISGTATATGTTGGTVQALGNQVVLDGNAGIDASGTNGGGTVLIGGDTHGANPGIPNAQNTFVGGNATLRADAIVSGDGGKVILWAGGTTQAYGNISARGGQQGGNGGFAETSGGWLDAPRAPDVSAPQGMGGTWLIDPYDIFIGVSNSTGTYTGSPNFVGAGPSPSIIGASVIAGVLDSGTSVIVDTTGSGGGVGNITIDSAVNTASASAATLTLKAHNDIVINAPLNMNNSLVLTADQDATGAGNVVINQSVIASGPSGMMVSGQDIIFASGAAGQLSGGAVSLTAAGAIIASPIGPAIEVVAQSLTMSAVNGIGNSGKVFVADVLGMIQFTNTNNAVNIYNGSTGAGRIFTGSNTNGPIRLESLDFTDATTVGTLTSGGNITLRMNNLTTDVAATINAGTNTVYLSPYTISPAVPSISIGGTETFNLTGADISRITAGKIVIGNDSFGNFAPTVNIAAASAVSVTNAAKLEIWGDTINTGPTGLSNPGGGVALIGDTMNIDGAVSSGSVWLRGKSSSQIIDLGGADTAVGTLGLTQAELSQIAATTALFVGNPLGTGSIHVSSAISLSPPTLGLGAGGGITQAGAATISATNLAIMAGGDVVLDTAPNSVVNLAAQVSGGASNFSFKNAGALNIGINIDGVSGILNGISMPSFANPDGVIALISGGALTQSAGALLAGSAVYAEGTKVILNAANPTGVIAGKSTGFSTGDIFNYTSSNAIMVTTVNGFSGIQTGSPPDPVSVLLNGGSAGIALNAPILAGAGARGINLNTTGNSAINNSISGSTINLHSTGGINFGAAASLNASGAGNAIVLNAGTGGFTNNASAGAGALNNTGGGSWLIYAAAPANVLKGGLTSDFRHYNGTFANYPPANVTETGNGFIYASVPGVLNVDTTLVSGDSFHIFGTTPTAQFGFAISNPASADNEDFTLIAGTPIFDPALSSTTPAGSYTVSYFDGLTSAAGYTFAPGTGLAYIIDPATLILVTAALTGTASKTYDGTTAATLAPGNFLLSGFAGSDSATVTKTSGTYASPNAGSGIMVSATLVATDFSPAGSTNFANYTLPTSASGSIGSIAPAPLSVVADARSKVYGGIDPALTYVASGLLLADTLTGSLTRATGENVGSYAIARGSLGNPNYTISYTGNDLSITPATLNVAANNAGKIYDAIPFSGGNGVTYSGLTNGDTAAALGGTLTYGGTSQGAINAGSYVITPGGLTSSNYIIGYANGELIITPAALGLLSVTANDASKAYGTTLTFAGTEFTPAGLLGGDTIASVTLTSPGAVDTANAGNYPITPSNPVFSAGSAGNYTISYIDGQLTVTPALLTVSADAISKAVGNADPALTYATAGLLFADTPATTLSGALARLAGETAGVYPIEQGTLTLLNSNYAMNFVPADFSIAAAPSAVVNKLVNDIILTPPKVQFEPPPTPSESAQTPAAAVGEEEKKDDEAAVVAQGGAPATEPANEAAALPVCK